MKLSAKLNRYKKSVGKVKQFDVVFERDESGYVVAIVPELPGCHTQGRTLAEAASRVKEAIGLYLEVLAERRVKPQSRQKFMGVKKIGVPVPA